MFPEKAKLVHINPSVVTVCALLSSSEDKVIQVNFGEQQRRADLKQLMLPTGCLRASENYHLICTNIIPFCNSWV